MKKQELYNSWTKYFPSKEELKKEATQRRNRSLGQLRRHANKRKEKYECI
tara:strand:- start:367 stop:516 length:150 start_codon:yes stop_codon:yes gene_type:complete